MDESLRALDLTTPQYSVLAQLELKPGASKLHLQGHLLLALLVTHQVIVSVK